MALTVRERSRTSYGTLMVPEEMSFDLRQIEPAPQVRNLVLGYEGIPSSAVYGFEIRQRMELKVNRQSTDRYAVHVGVALLDGAERRRIAPLVQSHSGLGDWLVLEPGRYLVVASIGMAVEVTFALEMHGRPARAQVKGLARTGASGLAVAAEEMGQALGVARGTGLAEMNRPQLAGLATATRSGLGIATLAGDLAGRMDGLAEGTSFAQVTLAEVVWVDGRGRRLGPDVLADPVNYDRPIERGADMLLYVALKDAQGSMRQYEGVTGTVELWDDRHVVQYASSALDAGYLAQGYVYAWFDDTVTATLPLPGPVYMEVKLIDSAGRIAYPLQGVWHVIEGYSR